MRSARNWASARPRYALPLLQLENEGFVTIIPRRGCVVNVLSLVDIRNIYQIIGALEASVIISEFHKFNPELIEHMRRFNEKARAGLDEDDFDKYYEYNLKFHNVYLNRTSNPQLVRIARTLKNRLYDFPRKKRYVKEWEVASTGEHLRLIELMAKGDAKGAGDFVRDIHWSYKVQEHFIREYYLEALENVKAAR